MDFLLKPPLGVGPHWYVYRKRITELNDAIGRYIGYIESVQHSKDTAQCYEVIAEWAKEIEHLALLEASIEKGEKK